MIPTEQALISQVRFPRRNSRVSMKLPNYGIFDDADHSYHIKKYLIALWYLDTWFHKQNGILFIKKTLVKWSEVPDFD